jgi:hypothetical protein
MQLDLVDHASEVPEVAIIKNFEHFEFLTGGDIVTEN